MEKHLEEDVNITTAIWLSCMWNFKLERWAQYLSWGATVRTEFIMLWEFMRMPGTQLLPSWVVKTHAPDFVLVPDGKRCPQGLDLDPWGHGLSVVPEILFFILYCIYYIYNIWYLTSVSVEVVSVTKLLLPKCDFFGFKDREIQGPNQQETGLSPKVRTCRLPDFKSQRRLNNKSWDSKDITAHWLSFSSQWSQCFLIS